MQIDKQKHYKTLLGLLGISALFFASTFAPKPAVQTESLWNTAINSAIVFARTSDAPMPDTMLYRTAQRLRGRLDKGSMFTPSIHEIANALLERQELFRKHVVVDLPYGADGEKVTWDVSLNRYPLWIKPEFSSSTAHFRLSAVRMQEDLAVNAVEGVPSPADVTLTGLMQDGEITRAITTGVAKSGYQLDVALATDALYQALTDGSEQLTIPLNHRPGVVDNLSGEDLGKLELLAVGRSNFTGSGWGRKQNVRKGLTQHVHNAIVPPGEEFSFNSLLGGSVSQGNGWHLAYVIVNGTDLELEPGGGICQVSTTVFRALLNAGLPVTRRKSHSLYVTYYEKFGVGLDATIYPGKQDLKFINDTGHPILVQAEVDENDDAFVSLYGTPDGRKVELNGPYFSANVPEGFTVDDRELQRNEIAWTTRVTYPDGTTREETILSRYKYIPKSLVAKYTAPEPEQISMNQ